MTHIRYDAVEKGFWIIESMAKTLGASIHGPRMGAGLAGGKWSEIEKLLNKVFIDNDIAVTIYDLEK